jgi:ABC-type glycerol-3-phosphate transport system permease component
MRSSGAILSVRARFLVRMAFRVLRRGALYCTIGAGGLLLLLPLLWMVSTSLKPMKQVYAWPPIWIPNPVEWQNYPEAWQEQPWALYYANTAVVTASCIVGILLSCSVAAYAFARLRFPGRDVMFMGLLATMMLPGQVTMIPLFLMFAKLGWVNTFKPLIVPSWLGHAFFIFLFRQFFMTIPRELDDAARIDAFSFH